MSGSWVIRRRSIECLCLGLHGHKFHSLVVVNKSRQKLKQILKSERDGGNISELDSAQSKPKSWGYSKADHVQSKRFREDNRILSHLVEKGKIRDACQFFEEIQEKTVVTWTILISGLSNLGFVEKARHMFDRMPERDTVAWNAMITCYVQNGYVHEAHKLFHEMPEKDLSSWNALITGYSQNGLLQEARQLFDEMSQRNVISWTTMITAYMQNCRVDDAKMLFATMPYRNIVSWNATIAGLAHNGQGEEALQLFQQMLATGMKPSETTFTSLISACSMLASLCLGRQVHTHVLKRAFKVSNNVFVGNALITMYARCGRLQYSLCLFERVLQRRDLVSWNSMISACAQHGYAQKSLKLFHEMLTLKFWPDEFSFLGVLAACSHAGLVDIGWAYFHSMSRDYGIRPKPGHYACMVDLLGKCGMLADAERFIRDMEVEPTVAVWKALLSACRNHCNAEIGARAAARVLALEPNNSAGYVLLSHTYAKANRWEDVARVRVRMRENGVKKEVGCSWIEVKNLVHVFVVDDTSHPEIASILKLLRQLSKQMQELGYVPDLCSALLNDSDEHREEQLGHHSERLAIAYGILKLPAGVPVQIMQNIRMCGDCHSAIKFISKIVGREIIVKDNGWFHHFNNGICSCDDYW